ncbi:unnamed protein product, partial [Amoebophrya sp. A120]
SVYPASCGLGKDLQLTGLYFDRVPDKTKIHCTFSDIGSPRGDAYLRQTHTQIATELIVETIIPPSFENKFSRQESYARCACPDRDLLGTASQIMFQLMANGEQFISSPQILGVEQMPS